MKKIEQYKKEINKFIILLWILLVY